MKITLRNFDHQINKTILERGAKYYRARKVRHLNEYVTNAWMATVDGSESEYEVEIMFNEKGEVISTTCDCPYDWGEYCKHQAAVMYAIKDRAPQFDYQDDGVIGIKQPNVQKKEETALSSEVLYSKYLKLSESDKNVVQLFALAYEPVSQTKFMTIYNRLFRYEGRGITTNETNNVKVILLKFVNEGFIKIESTGYRMPEYFSDFLLEKEYKKDPTFAKIIPAIQKEMEFSYYYMSQFDIGLRTKRELRFAYHQNKVDDFKRFYTEHIRYSNGRISQEDLVNSFVGESFNEQKIESIPLSIRAFLMTEKLSAFTFDLMPLNEYHRYVARNLDRFDPVQRASIARMLGQLCFFQGDFEGVKAFEKYYDALTQGVFIAWEKLLRGDGAAANEVFFQTQKVMRKETGSTKAYISGFGGIFYTYAMLKSQETSIQTKVKDLLSKLEKESSSFQNIYFYQNAILLYLLNDKRNAVHILTSRFPRMPIERFFFHISQYLIDPSLIDKSKLKGYWEHLKEGKFNWMAAEMQLLLNRLEPNEPAYEGADAILKNLGITPLLDLFPRVEEWENALNALINLTSNVKKGVEKEQDTRVIWLVNFEGRNDRWSYPLQPREQTFSKGTWTVGRAVALTRLKNGEVASMTDQDKRISRHIYGYSSSDAYIDFNKALPDLVGHPLLFLEKSPSVAVQLVEEKPVLIAKEVSNGYHLEFSHPIKEVGFNIIKESPTRYKLVNVADAHLRIAAMLNGKSLFIPVLGKERLEQAIKGLSNVVTVQSALDTTMQDLPSVEADNRVCVHLLPVGDGFHIELYAKPFGDNPPYLKIGKGETNIIAKIGNDNIQTKRDLNLEKQNLGNLLEKSTILRGINPRHDTWELEDTEQCLQLLLELQPIVDNKEIILEWPKGEKFKISKVVGFDQLFMKVRQKTDWFEVTGDIKVDEKTVLDMQWLLQIIDSKKQFVEIRPGQFLALTKEFKQKLQEISGLMDTTKDGNIRIHPLAGTAMSDFTSLLKNFESDKPWNDNLDKLKTAFKKKFTIPAEFKADLRPYQKEGFEWLSRNAAWGAGVCLADDMGLGKTIQALAFIQNRTAKGATLVVAPASVCRNWVAETEKFAPNLNPLLFGEGDRKDMVKTAKANDIIIVTYDLLQRESAIFTKKKFHTIILDEAQAIKNRNTKRSDTAMQLQGDFKMVMTGTPLENHLGELWNLFQFINPALLGSPEYFQEKFAAPIEKYKDDDRRQQLKRLIQPFILRRRKDEVLKELPAKTEIVLTVDLSPEERAFYETLRRDAIMKIEGGLTGMNEGQKQFQILAEIMRLRRAACHPKLVKPDIDLDSAKLRLFAEVVEELLDNGHKALVFSQFVGHLEYIEKYIKEKGIKYQYLDGQTPLKKRQERIDAFQNGEGDLFLISLKAGGVGLNLTAADYVIHMDPWWNPAVEDQASDRAHRIGQLKPVTVYRLVTEGTIEEKILQLHDRKRDLADSLLEGADMSAKLSAAEMLDLIKGR